MSFLTNRIKRDFLNTCEGITGGTVLLITPEGERRRFGQGQPEAEFHLRDWSVVTSTAARGDIGLGEAYVEGLWDTPCLETLMAVIVHNFEHFRKYRYGGFWQRFMFLLADRILRANSLRGASRNIRSHYDVGNEFYQLWLDRTMTYSSALFENADEEIEIAQNRKYNRILERIGGGDRVLEIGCGWGGFAEQAANQGRHVTGVTISPSQKAYADARLDGRADIELCDYRRTGGTYDAVVSIEMIEAVGQKYWPTYFQTVKSRLADGGRALVQAITVPDKRFADYRNSSDFIRRHVFPGGMLLSDQQIAGQAGAAGLQVKDNFAFGRDYSKTCRIWLDRFDQQSGKIAALGYGEKFRRSWRFYLGTCAASFASGHINVVQVELAHG